MTASPSLAEHLPDQLQATLLRFSPQQVSTPLGQMEYRQSGGAAAVTHVLLHGIGSGSGSWLMQLLAAEHNPRVNLLAWNAPGYGASHPLPADAPSAADYAQRMWAWLDVVHELSRDGSGPAAPFTLVGHSLGCLMAASAALIRPHQVQRLLLLSPAQGYANAPAAERDKKLSDRLQNLAELGPQGIAQKRGTAMLSANASAAQIALVQSVMAQIHPVGYTQAARLLAGGDLRSDLSQLAALNVCPIQVASGSADTITPPAGCEAVARQIGAPYTALPGAGHVCALEASARVNAFIGLPVGNTP